MSNFYRIIESSSEAGKIEAKISFNESHPLYKGHFPDSPITPGVVQLDVLKDVLETSLAKNLKLISLNRCKFLAPINPFKQSTFIYAISYTEDENKQIKVQGTLQDEEGGVFLKTNAVFEA